MASRDLKNKPLVEVILEVRWALEKKPPDLLVDPHYRLLLSRLFDQLSTDYPEPEELPAASMPDEMTGYMVKHRFRCAADDWPLVQIGPGIMTVNDTHKYTWNDFRKRSVAAVKKLFEAHPKPDQLEVQSLLLRYIDAVDMDSSEEDVFAFLRNKLKVTVGLPESLFDKTGVHREARRLVWESSFKTITPEGAIKIRFVSGQHHGKPALIWETLVLSEEALPTLPDGFEDWIGAAHGVTEDWFFKLIKGELETRFSGDQL